LLNSANEAAACLLELANKDHQEKFSSLEEIQAYMREQVWKQKRHLQMKLVKTMMTMMNRLKKQLDFKLNINCVSLTEHINNYFQTGIVCLQTKSSLGALWELSGSLSQLRVYDFIFI
jgi:hypothetical protein